MDEEEEEGEGDGVDREQSSVRKEGNAGGDSWSGARQGSGRGGGEAQEDEAPVSNGDVSSVSNGGHAGDMAGGVSGADCRGGSRDPDGCTEAEGASDGQEGSRKERFRAGQHESAAGGNGGDSDHDESVGLGALGGGGGGGKRVNIIKAGNERKTRRAGRERKMSVLEVEVRRIIAGERAGMAAAAAVA